MILESFDLFDPSRRAELARIDTRNEFLLGFHSIVSPSHDDIAYQTHKWTLKDTKSLWQEQVDYMEGGKPGEGHDPGWGEKEESLGYSNGLIHGREFLEAYDEPYYESAR